MEKFLIKTCYLCDDNYIDNYKNNFVDNASDTKKFLKRLWAKTVVAVLKSKTKISNNRIKEVISRSEIISNGV